MRVLLSTYGSRAAELVAEQFDTVAAVAAGSDELAAGGMMPIGV